MDGISGKLIGQGPGCVWSRSGQSVRAPYFVKSFYKFAWVIRKNSPGCREDLHVRFFFPNHPGEFVKAFDKVILNVMKFLAHFFSNKVLDLRTGRRNRSKLDMRRSW